ncbi:MAG: MarR family transcriptional regulator [Deltaproteobacteria bacterium]|nr:MarR family transcriptional regulator [Deltaproteobacteria bacterium]
MGKAKPPADDRIPAVLTECPYYLISRTSLLGTSALKRELRAAGVEHVRPAYLGVLMSLWREDGLIVVELGRRVGLEPSTMTGLLDRMGRDGLLERSPDPTDRRVQRIHLTESGRAVERPVTEVVNRALGKMLEGVSESDLMQLKRTLQHVLGNADKLNRP